MSMLHKPSLTEDVKHTSLIAVSALAALLVTGGLVLSMTADFPGEAEVYTTEADFVWSPLGADVDFAAGADRIYGRVLTKSGEEHVGYLRWNGREASWADVMPANEARGSAVAGLRFGHMTRLDPVDARTLRVSLKSGGVTEVTAIPTERGAGLLPVSVEDASGDLALVPWLDVASVELLPEPLNEAPRAERIHGTVITKSGMGFTGYVTWDLDESFLNEVLEGSDAFVSFAQIASIHRRQEGGVRVVTQAGKEFVLIGTRDVDKTNRGIAVADPTLGSVVIPFERFAELRMHPAEVPASYETFDGGTGIVGSVVTESGESISGRVRWDRDEAGTWELLDGQYNGVHFHIEFSQIAWIQKTWLGATVELRDGRSFYLLASNDVNWTNKGIEVAPEAGAARVVEWSDFHRIDFAPAPETGPGH